MKHLIKLKLFSRFILIDGLFEGGRMFVGATSITYLMSVGVTFKEVAVLKGVQAFVLIFGEVPTGIIADSFGRKRSLIFGALCAIASFLIYYSSKTFPFFVGAEILAALSLCFWSGAFEALAIDTARLDESEGVLSRFFQLNMSMNSFAIMICGLAGGYLALKGLNIPFLGAVLCYFLMLILIGSLPEEARPEKADFTQLESGLKKIKFHFEAALKEGLLYPHLLPFFLVNVAIQFLIQPLLHYWQPLFQAISPSISTSQQGFIFSTYCGVSALFGLIYSKWSGNSKSPVQMAILFFIFSLLYFLMGFVNHLGWAILIFACLQGFLALCRASLAAKMNEVIASRSRASILSTLSLISRLGMMGALPWIGSQMNQDDPGSITKMFRAFGGISFLLIVLLMMGVFYFNKRHKKS